MYTLEKIPTQGIMKNGGKPLATLKNENNGVFHIIKDEHCFCLVRQTRVEYPDFEPFTKNIPVIHFEYLTHWFSEAIEALKTLSTQ